MSTEWITVEVDAEAARLFKDASPERRRVLGALISLHLLEAAAALSSGQGSRDALRALMDAVSQRAQERGLTEELLDEILAEAEAARRED
jgi:hypothetical protein